MFRRERFSLRSPQKNERPSVCFSRAYRRGELLQDLFFKVMVTEVTHSTSIIVVAASRGAVGTYDTCGVLAWLFPVGLGLGFSRRNTWVFIAGALRRCLIFLDSVCVFFFSEFCLGTVGVIGVEAVAAIFRALYSARIIFENKLLIVEHGVGGRGGVFCRGTRGTLFLPPRARSPCIFVSVVGRSCKGWLVLARGREEEQVV